MQDQNFRVRAADGTQYVAKIVGPHTPAEAIDLQNAALRQVARRRNGFASPELIPTRDGQDTVHTDGHRVRLLTWVEGVALSERVYLGPADLRALGALAARVAVALDGLAHPALDWDNGWDVRLAARVLTESLPYLPPAWAPDLRAAIAAVQQVPADLPTAVVHGDLTPVNAVCLPGDDLRSTPVGVLDFGDIMRSWRVGDAAATAVGAVEHPGTGDSLAAVLAVLTGYHATTPLTEVEIDAFWPLVVARAAVTAAISYRQLVGNTGNDYAQDSVESGERAMRRIAAIHPAVAAAATRLAVGLPAVPGAEAARRWLAGQPWVPIVPDLDTAVPVDLSADADAFAHGEWSDAAALRQLLSGAGHPAVGRWGEARLAGAARPTPEAPATLQLGSDVFVPAGTPVSAPLAGTVRRAGADHVLLDLGADAHGLLLRIGGIAPAGIESDAQLPAGAPLGTVRDAGGLLPPAVHVQLVHAALADSGDVPTCGDAGHRDAWLALCPDPSPLLGVHVAAPASGGPADALHERQTVVAGVQHTYYDQPPQIVRGWRQHLYDSTGRSHLDMINNIAAVGHSHPRVTAAAVRQLRRLNTNSRFLYDSMTRYAERIAALLPPELDTVLFVNSGSEAADLALQLARRSTGRRDVIALAGAYHGWTGTVLDLSTSPMDRPNWRAELPPWVHIADQPDTYRGVHGADSAAYRASVQAACAESDGGPAAFISEPLLGNQGGVELPPGYLRDVYADVRAAGGLCLADEVQVGMARTGDTFWAFEHEDVVPDIVFTAKAAGNGHPLGVVVCRREIADAFDADSVYFSSTGGGPVSCEVGLAVLDVMRDERLQDNARVVGGHLKARLQQLAGRHPLIGAVHGRGLYLGVDLVLDHDRRTPARYEALAVSERLRHRGVIMQPTGDAFNVLKVKPPMCLDRVSADYFVAALDAVLTELT